MTSISAAVTSMNEIASASSSSRGRPRRRFSGRRACDLQAEGVDLLVAHDIGQVRDTLRETGTTEELGDQNVYPSVAAAVAAARST